MTHQNNGACEKCREIFNKYVNFHLGVRGWFIGFQAKHPEAHISCAGRGSIDQAAAFANKRSRCQYGESAHNYNCAIDLFVILPNKGIYDKEWFTLVLGPEVPAYLEWYGAEGAKFYELPHIELRDWKYLKDELTLVEPPHARRV